VDERVLADGPRGKPPARCRAAREGLKRYRAQGFDAVAIALIPRLTVFRHEQILAALAREAGLAQVSVRQRGLAPDEAGGSRRHHGGGRLSLSQ